MRYVLIAAAAALLIACTDPQNATRILADQGYTNIRMTGYAWLSCSNDDTYHSGFVATSPAGKDVRGTVCAGGFFKNSTIRFE